MAAPVQRGEELDLSIESLAFGGNGVARLDGFVVFVRRGLPGDRVRAHVLKTQRRHAEAVVVEVLEPGPVRVDAPCKHYPTCGGCRFQDLAYETQLEAKHSWVRDSLERIAGIQNPPLEPIVPATETYGYRNKMEYSFVPGEDGGELQLGFHAAGRWDTVLQIDECLLTSELGNNIRNAVRAWAIEDKLTAYDQREQKGYLRHLMLREGRNTGEMLVQLVTNKGERFDRERFIEVVTQFPEVKSVHWSVNEAPSENTNLPTELQIGRAHV